MKNSWLFLAFVTLTVLTLATLRMGAASVQPTSETYSWSGELVAFDAGGRTLTVKSRVVGDQALAELPRFTKGDRIVLTWSGFDTYGDGISRTVRYDAAKKWSGPFTFPVEFVMYEAPPRQYVTFTVTVPASSAAPLASVKPGEWVTVISKHRASSEAEAITAVNAYTATASRASSE